MTTHASQSSTATPLRTKWHTNSYLTEEHRTGNRKYASTDSGTRTTRDSREHLLQSDIGIRVLKNGKAPGLDDIQTELIKQFGPKARDWLLRFFNNCTGTKKIPKLWRQAKVVALLKPGKDPSVAKSFRPISLLCHTYKLFERLILNRIAEHVDAKLIPEQAGFRAGKSCTSQLLNLTEHIEDGYEKRLITGAVFVDLSAAYDTVNHRRLLSKVLEMTGDVQLTDLIRTMLENRRFFVVLNGKKSRWRRQRNGLPQGSVLAPMLFNIYTNDQPIHPDTRSFIYADDLCIASQGNDFNTIEASLTSALSAMTSRRSRIFLRRGPLSCEVPSRRDSVGGGVVAEIFCVLRKPSPFSGGGGSSRIFPWSPNADRDSVWGGGGSSRIFPWSPNADRDSVWGGGVVAEFWRHLTKPARFQWGRGNGALLRFWDFKKGVPSFTFFFFSKGGARAPRAPP